MEEVATMPSNAQEFCLRWNNFHSSLVTALDGFKNDLDFVDVTLACEGQFIKAHKMLLSACSVFFRDLLKANPCQHPIVILPPEVRFNDLEKMLRFIYQGEVNVHQENLARFLKTAEMLKIRGLADDNEKQKVLQASSPRPPDNCSGGSGSGNERNDNSSVSPKRPRLSIDTQSGSFTDAPQTPNDENSRLSGPDSDSEMIPVKQEMIELKECDFDTSENESFLAETYLRENSSATSSNNTSITQPPQTHPAAPPPPGPLLPSYVPPPQVKAQDDSPIGTNHDELSQGRAAAIEEEWRALHRHQETLRLTETFDDVHENRIKDSLDFDYFGFSYANEGESRTIHLESVRRGHVCPVCGRRISNPSNLRKHMHRAHGTANLTCPVCGKAYRASCDLRRHAIASHNLRLDNHYNPAPSPSFSSLIYDDPFDSPEAAASEGNSNLSFASRNDYSLAETAAR